jgi:hypothetical protein
VREEVKPMQIDNADPTVHCLHRGKVLDIRAPAVLLGVTSFLKEEILGATAMWRSAAAKSVGI